MNGRAPAGAVLASGHGAADLGTAPGTIPGTGSIVAALGRVGLVFAIAATAPVPHLFAPPTIPPAIRAIPDQEMNYEPNGAALEPVFIGR